MAKKKVKKERTAEDIASELLEVRLELNSLKGTEKLLADELKRRMKNGEKQSYFRIVESYTLRISDAFKAMAWAQKSAPQAIKVDATIARQIFLQDALIGTMGTPESNGFALKTTETLRENKEERDVAEEEGVIQV